MCNEALDSRSHYKPSQQRIYIQNIHHKMLSIQYFVLHKHYIYALPQTGDKNMDWFPTSLFPMVWGASKQNKIDLHIHSFINLTYSVAEHSKSKESN